MPQVVERQYIGQPFGQRERGSTEPSGEAPAATPKAGANAAAPDLACLLRTCFGSADPSPTRVPGLERLLCIQNLVSGA